MADAMARRYEILRQRAAGQAQGQAQEEDDALKRRFAANGGLNSGAFVKQQQMTKDRQAQRMQAAREGVDVAEMAERGQLEEAERGRTWQSGEAEKQRGWGTKEREAGQTWQSGEAGAQRAWGTSEREAGQTWQSGEAATQRAYQTGERRESQAYDWQKFRSQFEESVRQFNLGYDMDQQMMELNKQIASYSMPDKTPYWQKKDFWSFGGRWGGGGQGLGATKNAIGSGNVPSIPGLG